MPGLLGHLMVNVCGPNDTHTTMGAGMQEFFTGDTSSRCGKSFIDGTVTNERVENKKKTG